MENNIDFILRHPSTEGKKWKYAIVVQGDYRSQTPLAIKEMIERNPNDETLFIFSTYAPDQERRKEKPYGSFLTDFEKQFIERGKIIYVFIYPPTWHECPSFWQTNLVNQNLQRFSSFLGIKIAYDLEIPLTLKSRSDAFFGVKNICNYLDEISSDIPIIDPDKFCKDNLHRRFVVSDHSKQPTNSVGHYHIYDHWLFGETRDLLHFYDIREGAPWRYGVGNTKEFVSCINVESNFTELWMIKLGIPFSIVKNIRELSARYLYVTSSLELEFVWLKSPDHQEYFKIGKEYQKREFSHKDEKIDRLVKKEDWLIYLKDFVNSLNLKDFNLKEPKIASSFF